MTKKDNSKTDSENDMLSEYDFSQGIRGKHFQDYRQGHQVKIKQSDGSIQIHYFQLEDGAVMLDSDVRKHFSSSEEVNQALRSLVAHS